MFCDVCKKLGFSEDGHADESPLWSTKTHHETCASFRDSVSRGCYICTTLWRDLLPDDQRFVFDSAETEMDEQTVVAGSLNRKTQDRAMTDARLTVSFLSRVTTGCILAITFKSMRLPSDEEQYRSALFTIGSLDSVQLNRSVKIKSMSTKSTETLSLAKSWVEDCATNHQQCNANNLTETWYPTRLLDCGSAGIPGADCRLVESGAAELHGSYMTLSHCWGLEDCLKLTQNNYAQMMDIIPSRTLPQLYQDAVYITRMLRVRYLWIDSLCIIQEGDEQNDWAREVKNMGKIYSNSHCTISAANAPNGHHSMFCSRKVETISPQVARFSIDGHISSCLVSDLRTWERQVSCALINTRGWVLQERILSPRVLYFGEQQIFWECLEGDRSETYSNGMPQQMASDSRDLQIMKHHVEASAEDRSAAYRTWYSLVSTYTRTKLSFPSDKVAAFSAIAKEMSRILKDEYIVGMWRRSLESELLWSVETNSTVVAARPAIYRAPTWSWMAVDGAINTNRQVAGLATDLLFEVVHVEVDYLTDDHTGTVRGGYLQLRGTLKKMMLVESRHASGQAVWIMHIDGDQIDVSVDFGDMWPRIMLDPPYSDSTWQSKGSVLYYMPGELYPRRQRTDDMIKLLILEVTDEENGVYRRVGLARVWGRDTRMKILRPSQQADSFPCEEYSDGKHLIRVI